MSDKDRKEWELTDEERRMVALSVTPDKLPDAMAKVAARKALEWAAQQASNPRDLWAPTLANYIRKELSDG